MLVVLVVLAAVLTAVSARYGYHRDELYFLAAGRHLAWGYVDQPPLTPLLARASTAVFGDSPAGLRVVATAAAALTVWVAALLARETGGGRRAQVLAAAATAVSAIVLTSGHMVSTVTFDLLAWLLLCLLAARLLRTGDGRWYVPVGAVAGVAVLNKYLVVLLLVVLAVSLLLVGPRRIPAGRWLVAGVLLAFVIAAPNVWWQAHHGWPQFSVASGIERGQGVSNRATFIPFQFVYLAPPLAPLWIAGWLRLWRDPALRPLRLFAVAYPLAAVIVLASGGKSYYVLPLLVVLMAAGAEPAVRWAARGPRRGWVLPATIAVVAAVNILTTLPVLPPRDLGPVNAVNKEQGEQVGWPRFVATVAEAWRRIPSDQRKNAVIYTQNYGEAAAIERYGPAYGLPRPYSGHMSYGDWGPPPDSAGGPVLIVHYPANTRLASQFLDCVPLAVVDDGYALSNDEQGTVVQKCAGPIGSWSSRWPALRTYD
ncbi:MAG: hypothetical protein HOV83_02415 [Catenulispora sp.]|nr:hypothetical protein [Catenulispora sp.]